ncbi:hypothetical protein [Pseudomonas frederiksbergensis]|uniref:Uncharacterized protein n=1 Tax=Pseudomonas frederiksbergensis TaxID=104087 RepID=A0A423HPR1_9PSED|nr:hypothetical protein [Pseudomonas frederiksbergensis]RON15200.1 hypothetical protein BK662_13910 [Pseudomonas frederiksbergensis]
MPYSTPDTYIVDGNITIFLGSHSEIFKQDILHSSLLGHLISNSHSIASDAWMSSYKKTLESLSWITRSTAQQLMKKQSMSILKFAKPALSGHLSTAELKELSDVLGIIKNLPKDSDAIAALLNRIQIDNDRQPSITTVCPLLTVISANKTVISFRLVFDTSHPVDLAILDEELSQKVVLDGPQTTQWSAYLAEEKYASVRDKIIEKLGSKIKTNLHHLTPPEDADIRNV